MRTYVTKIVLSRDVRINKNVGDPPFLAFDNKRYGFVDKRRRYQNTVYLTIKDSFCFGLKRLLVVQIKKVLFQYNAILLDLIDSSFNSTQRSLPKLCFFRLGYQYRQMIDFLGGKPACKNIRLKVDFFYDLINALFSALRHSGPVMDDTIHSSNRNVSPSGYFLYSRHLLAIFIFHNGNIY